MEKIFELFGVVYRIKTEVETEILQDSKVRRFGETKYYVNEIEVDFVDVNLETRKVTIIYPEFNF